MATGPKTEGNAHSANILSSTDLVYVEVDEDDPAPRTLHRYQHIDLPGK